MRNKIVLVIALLFAVAHTNAWAQAKKGKKPDKKDAKKDGTKKEGDEVTLEPDTPDPDGLPSGARENPDAPIFVGEKKIVVKKAPKKVAAGYPLEVVDRPLTLYRNMAQVAIDYPINVDPFIASGTISGQFGVTNEAELGLRYGFGAMDSVGFLEGKVFAVEFGYSFNNWASVRVSVPVLVDPFAMGVRIGAPLRFKVMDKLALVGGHDLISFKLVTFVPEVTSPTATAALVALDESNTVLPRGEFRFLGGVIYQHSKKLAFMAEIGVIAPDFGLDDQPVPLHIGAMLSGPFKAGVDYGLRIGFGNLDEAKNTFGVTLFAALRI
jgi:hypothetical protein